MQAEETVRAIPHGGAWELLPRSVRSLGIVDAAVRAFATSAAVRLPPHISQLYPEETALRAAYPGVAATPFHLPLSREARGSRWWKRAQHQWHRAQRRSREAPAAVSLEDDDAAVPVHGVLLDDYLNGVVLHRARCLREGRGVRRVAAHGVPRRGAERERAAHDAVVPPTPLSFDELRGNPKLLSKERRHLRRSWSGRSSATSEQAYGAPVPYQSLPDSPLSEE